MTNDELDTALSNVDNTYDTLKSIADEIVAPLTYEVNTIISALSNIEGMSVEQLRDLIMKLSIASFSFSESKDKALFKATIAESLRKEKYAVSFSIAEGTVAIRESTAQLKSSPETACETLYELVSNLLKTKLDECHRVVDAAKSVLMSKMQEAKYLNIATTAPEENTFGG